MMKVSDLYRLQEKLNLEGKRLTNTLRNFLLKTCNGICFHLTGHEHSAIDHESLQESKDRAQEKVNCLFL